MEIQSCVQGYWKHQRSCHAMITLAFVATGLAIFTAQVLSTGLRNHYRRESRGFAFARVENVYPKYRHE